METMTLRFSDLPLSRRVIAVVITLAICAAIYWLASSVADALPFAANAALTLAVLGFGFWAIWLDKKRRGRLPPQQINRRSHRDIDRRY